jgi:hypothetical protein
VVCVEGETYVETSSKVDALNVDDVTLTEGSLDFFSAAAAFVTRRIEIVDKAWYLL